MLLLAVISALAVTNADNAYQQLVTLPIPLKQPITAIYNDNLYVFGGQNDTAVNTRMWRISLANKFALSGQTDVTHTLHVSQWVEIDVTYPSYGVSKAGAFLCTGQCSATIWQYLYIVNPFNSSDALPTYASNVIYRVDLSSDPPTFAGQNDFDFGYGVRFPCVTAVADQLYVTNGIFNLATYSTEIVVYDPATNTMTTLTANTGGVGRRDAGCAGNEGESNLYLLGGRSTSPYTYGYPIVDYYGISSDSWTNPLNDASNYNFDTDNGPNTRGRFRCLTVPYRNQIECPGGNQASPLPNAVIYDIDADSSSYVDLAQAVQSYGLEKYEFANDGNYSASVMLIIGGYSTDLGEPTNITQYAVRYTTITPQPTTDPTESPTTDTWSPTAHTSSPTTDTGSPTTDTSSPTTVSLSPSADSSSPTADTLSPTIDTWSPTTDTSSPTTDTASPTAETSSPAHSSSPTADTSSPTSLSTSPTADASSSSPSMWPTVDTSAPTSTADTSSPTTVFTSPTSFPISLPSSTPTTDTSSPTVGTSAPTAMSSSAQPTDSPTALPTAAPTTEEPRDGDGKNSATVILSFVLVFVSVLYIIVL